MPTFQEYFLNSRSDVVKLETFEFIHPDFSKVYRVVRNSISGIDATLETSEAVHFDYMPLKIENSGIRNDLDQSISIQFGDLGELIPNELDLVLNANGFETKPIVKYRLFRSDDLTEPFFGPVVLEITDIAFTKKGCQFEAKAPSLNISKTGEIYSIGRFPMLRGFL